MGQKLSFNPLTKIISVTSPPVLEGTEMVVDLDIKIDLYSDAKEDWVADESLRKFRFPLRAVGGDPLPGSKALGSTFFLTPPWKIRPYEASHTFRVNGNLYTEDGTSPFTPSLGSWNIFMQQSVSSLVDSTVQQLNELQYAAFQGAVYLDVVNGTNSIKYPAGTHEYPCKTLINAKTILASRGFEDLRIIGDITLNSGDDVANLNVVGQGASFNASRTIITMVDGCITTNTHFKNARIEGYQGGEAFYTNCVIGEIYKTHCQFNICGLLTSSHLVNSEWTTNHTTTLNNCYTEKEFYVTDYNDSPMDQIYSNQSGRLKFINITDDRAKVIIQLNSGEIWIDSSCTAGSITIKGIGTLIDDSSGTCTINTNGLMSKETIADAVNSEIGNEIQYAAFGGAISINVLDGSPGTTYPIGTQLVPSNNLTESQIIADSKGFSLFKLFGNITIEATDDISEYEIDGLDRESSTLTLVDGATNVAAIMRNLTITGHCGGRMNLHDCYLHDIIGLCASGGNANIENTLLKGTIQMRTIADMEFLFIDCIGSADDLIIDVNHCTASIHFAGFKGNMLIKNVTEVGQHIDLDMTSGEITFDSTCTSGEVHVRGVGSVIDNSGPGCSINTKGLMSKATVASAILDADVTSHNLPDSVGLTLAKSEYKGIVFVDNVNGEAGITYPTGTFEHQVNNEADMITLMNKYNINHLHFHSNFTLSSGTNITYMVLESHNSYLSALTIAPGVIANDPIFRSIKVKGVMPGVANFTDCYLEQISNVSGDLKGCMLDEDVSFTSGSMTHVQMHGCRSHYQTPVELNVNDAMVNATGWAGMLNIKNKTGMSEFNLHCTFGGIWIDSTCVAGTIYLAGSGILMADNSGPGCTVVNMLRSSASDTDAVWNADPNAYADGTIGAKIADIPDEVISVF